MKIKQLQRYLAETTRQALSRSLDFERDPDYRSDKAALDFAMAVHTAMAAQIRYIIRGLPVGGTKALRHIAAHAFQADFPLINWPQDRADWAKVEEEAYEMFAAMVAEKIVEAVGYWPGPIKYSVSGRTFTFYLLD